MRVMATRATCFARCQFRQSKSDDESCLPARRANFRRELFPRVSKTRNEVRTWENCISWEKECGRRLALRETRPEASTTSSSSSSTKHSGGFVALAMLALDIPCTSRILTYEIDYSKNGEANYLVVQTILENKKKSKKIGILLPCYSCSSKLMHLNFYFFYKAFWNMFINYSLPCKGI